MGRLFLCLLCVALVHFCSAQTGRYQLSTPSAPLESVLLELESRYDLRFSYSPQILDNQTIRGNFSANELESFLTQVLAGTGLEFQLQGEGYVALRKASLALLKICGSVIDSASGAPLAYARVRLSSSFQGGYTDAKGYFSLTVAPESQDTLLLQYGGYKTRRVPAGKRLTACPELRMSYVGFESEGVVIEDYLTDGVSLGKEGEMVVLRPKRASAFPGQAAPDILHSVRFLPGISSPGGELSQLYVRGGTPDQSLVMWEGIPMYHTAHYFGMVSAINPYYVEEVRVYRGSFGADMGGRIAGIVDMRSPGLEKRTSSLGGGIDMMHAFTQGTTHLFNGKANVSFSLRRSTSDLWESPTYNAYTNRIVQGNLVQKFNSNSLPDGVEVNTDFRFWDGHIKAQAELSRKDQLTATIFRLDNAFASRIDDRLPSGDVNNQDDSLSIYNNGFGLKWDRQWNDNWRSSIQGLSTQYELDYFHKLARSTRPKPERAERKNVLTEQQIQIRNEYDSKAGIRLQFGYQLQRFDVSYIAWERMPQLEPPRRVDGSVHTLFASLRLAQHPIFGAEIGSRLSLFTKDGQLYPEPRLKGWATLGRGKRIYAHLGRYQQFVSQLSELGGANIGMQPPVWFLSDTKDLRVLTSYHAQLGTILEQGPWLLDVQAYIRYMDGLSLRTSALGIEFDDDLPLFGTGLARGLDILLKWRNRKWKSWISYSLGKVDNRFRAISAEDFAAPHDVRHQLNWVVMLDYKRWQCSMAWMGRTGTPYTEVFSSAILIPPDTSGTGPTPPATFRPDFSEINGARTGFHHSLNTSIQYRFGNNESNKPYGLIGLSVQNLYNAQNVYLRTYVFSRRNMQDQYLPVDRLDLGITPNVTVQFFW